MEINLNNIQEEKQVVKKPHWSEIFNENTIYAAYTNLDERADRNNRMIEELTKAGFKVIV